MGSDKNRLSDTANLECPDALYDTFVCLVSAVVMQTVGRQFGEDPSH
jgi:hypothetical protein